MYCATCASKLQFALTSIDGVTAATVNYATERASIVYDADQTGARRMLQAVRSEKFDVPLVGLALYSPDLVYATSERTVERALLQADGIVFAATNLSTGRIDVLAFSEYQNRPYLEAVLKRLGFTPAQQKPQVRTESLHMRFLAATTIALFLAITIAGYLGGVTGVAHLVSLSTDLLVSGVGLGFIGYPFLRRAFVALVRGRLDPGVLVALAAVLTFLLGLVCALFFKSKEAALYSTALASFAVSSVLLAGWFLVRTWQLYFESSRPSNLSLASQSLGIVSAGLDQPRNSERSKQ